MDWRRRMRGFVHMVQPKLSFLALVPLTVSSPCPSTVLISHRLEHPDGTDYIKKSWAVKLEAFSVPDPGCPNPGWPSVWPTCSHAAIIREPLRLAGCCSEGGECQLPQTGSISTQHVRGTVVKNRWDEIYPPSCEDLPSTNLPRLPTHGREAVVSLLRLELIRP